LENQTEVIDGIIEMPDLPPKIKDKFSAKILFFVKKDDAWSKVALNHIEKVGKKYAIEVETIDAEKDPQIAEAYNVSALPTIIINDRQLVGIIQIAHLEEIIKQMLEQQSSTK
jgi:hypothetical protein